jgi:hypothetical protein
MLGVKQTSKIKAAISAFDPTETLSRRSPTLPSRENACQALPTTLSGTNFYGNGAQQIRSDFIRGSWRTDKMPLTSLHSLRGSQPSCQLTRVPQAMLGQLLLLFAGLPLPLQAGPLSTRRPRMPDYLGV